MTTWPVGVTSSPLINTLTGGPDDTVLRTKNDVGPPVMRNRYTGFCFRYSFNLHMTAAQFATFKTFFHTTLGNGALPFDFVDPVDGTTREFSFTAIYQINSMEAHDQYIIGVSIVSEPQ